MQKVIKQAVGIDCGKEELVVSIANLDAIFEEKNVITFGVSNDVSGFEKLCQMIKKQQHDGIEAHLVVEATGVYHERLCYFLAENGLKISIILPNRAASFMRTLSIKTINDKISSAALAILGLQKKLDVWRVPEPTIYHLRQLSRERTSLLEDTTSMKNQIHALMHSAILAEGTLKRMQLRLEISQAQLAEIEQEMKLVIAGNKDLKQRFDNVCTIKGVGLITAVTVVAETNAFNLIRNQRQLVSYAGLDVVKKESGTSIKTPGRISHKGNVHLRKALHFPALAAVRYDDKMKDCYSNLLAKHNIKMKAAVAIQRKILVLIYTLWKNNEAYDVSKSAGKYLEQSKKTALTELDLVRS